MANYFNITEKPSAAQNFVKALGGKVGQFEGNNFNITNLRGHVMTLKEPEEMVPAGCKRPISHGRSSTCLGRLAISSGNGRISVTAICERVSRNQRRRLWMRLRLSRRRVWRLGYCNRHGSIWWRWFIGLGSNRCHWLARPSPARQFYGWIT